MANNRKMIIVSAPSGAGKTTIVKYLLANIPNLTFSVSACSRQKRPNEIEGVSYYFMSIEEFKAKIQNDEFVEWQQVYENKYYGTLKSEIERIWDLNKYIAFDVDVLGALNIKKLYGSNALSIFIMPPSLEVLEQRLRNRNTNSEEDIRQRLQKAKFEMSFSDQFDNIIINDDLQTAEYEALTLVTNFLNNREV
ncbi:MAG: guanylate kinase [Bacteroidales bacterium]|nr:guanylate kinase [Bacteroidales bacterium]MBP5782603.1 guanylate kinase [Bacteroidales bacterium]MBR5651577.1 guanylate kinase [Bacteroidales bacterium]MBR5719428.1 guanylate kinase [Bacteroidales bacterium]MBR6491866.1 guanylate kinase [Bacteroidales bacterium]